MFLPKCFLYKFRWLRFVENSIWNRNLEICVHLDIFDNMNRSNSALAKSDCVLGNWATRYRFERGSRAFRMVILGINIGHILSIHGSIKDSISLFTTFTTKFYYHVENGKKYESPNLLLHDRIGISLLRWKWRNLTIFLSFAKILIARRLHRGRNSIQLGNDSFDFQNFTCPFFSVFVDL